MTAPEQERVRFDWGPAGARESAAGATYVVVVDVLSFSTAVSVAVDAGVEVYPYPWADATAGAFARQRSATLAVGRRRAARDGGVSLSPVSLSRARGLTRLVLPSPNGAAITLEAAERGRQVVAGCLRNRRVVAEWLLQRLEEEVGATVCVLAAGERWPADGSLRPAVEDLWGAGAVIAALRDGGLPQVGPEAQAAEAAFRAVNDLEGSMRCCASGRELIARGFEDDVVLAAELDVSTEVPVLTPPGCYVGGRPL